MEVPKIIREYWKLLLIVSLMIFGITWRLMPHVPNFAPIGAIALLGGMALGWRTAVWLPLSVMLISDLAIGFYAGIEWTWLSFILIVGLAYALKHLSFGWRLGLGALGASLLFYTISNFGVWVASGMYPATLTGLIDCYVMGVPFLRATLLSDLVFASMLLGGYELASHLVILTLKPTSLQN